MLKFAAYICVIAASVHVAHASNPLTRLKTESIYGIIYAQMAQGMCAKTPAILELERRLYDGALNAAEEVELLALGAELAVCNVNNEKKRAEK